MTNLALVTTATTKPRHRSRRSAQNRTVQELATVWNYLSGPEKSSWHRLSGQMAKPHVNGLPNPVNAYATFIKANALLLGSGQPMLLTAPPAPVAPDPLPICTLSASMADGQVALTLHSPTVYNSAVTVYAARPLLAGTTVYGQNAFRRIGSLSALAAGPNALGALYLVRYNIRGPGYEIAVKLVGVTGGGFPTSDTLVTAVVTE